MSGLPETFARDGFCVIDGVLHPEEVARLVGVVEAEVAQGAGRGGVRNLLEIPGMRVLAESEEISGIARAALEADAQVVRGILFDKTGEANWKVPWHQDVTIAVAARVDAEGYGPWSVKAGVTHVQPPAEVLERMVSVRFHLDDCPEENGALKVVAGSHRAGKIPESEIGSVVAEGDVQVCAVGAGGVLVMRPLLVHSSAASLHPGRRRVLHFDYASGSLSQGLGWAH